MHWARIKVFKYFTNKPSRAEGRDRPGGVGQAHGWPVGAKGSG